MTDAPGRHLLYLLGEPGSGMTTLAAELTARAESSEQVATGPGIRKFPFTLWLAADDDGICLGDRWPVVELGLRREIHSGTDAMPFDSGPHVEKWLRLQPYRLILAEGSSFADERFFVAAETAGYELTIGHLIVPAEIAEARRAERNLPRPAAQIRHARARVELLTTMYRDHVIELDGSLNPEWAAMPLRQHPVVKALHDA